MRKLPVMWRADRPGTAERARLCLNLALCSAGLFDGGDEGLAGDSAGVLADALSGGDGAATG